MAQSMNKRISSILLVILGLAFWSCSGDSPTGDGGADTGTPGGDTGTPGDVTPARDPVGTWNGTLVYQDNSLAFSTPPDVYCMEHSGTMSLEITSLSESGAIAGYLRVTITNSRSIASCGVTWSAVGNYEGGINKGLVSSRNISFQWTGQEASIGTFSTLPCFQFNGTFTTKWMSGNETVVPLITCGQQTPGTDFGIIGVKWILGGFRLNV